MRVSYSFYLNDDSSKCGPGTNTLSIFAHDDDNDAEILWEYRECDVPPTVICQVAWLCNHAGKVKANYNGCIGWDAYMSTTLKYPQEKRGPEYYRGRDDAAIGAPPDYSQERDEDFKDYCAGYRDGKQGKR